MGKVFIKLYEHSVGDCTRLFMQCTQHKTFETRTIQITKSTARLVLQYLLQ